MLNAIDVNTQATCNNPISVDDNAEDTSILDPASSESDYALGMSSQDHGTKIAAVQFFVPLINIIISTTSTLEGCLYV